MTIPQIISVVGWSIAFIGFVLIAELDDWLDIALPPTLRDSVGIPAIILGVLIGVGGLVAEYFRERSFDRHHDDDQNDLMQ